jgi:hypothetical protein
MKMALMMGADVPSEDEDEDQDEEEDEEQDMWDKQHSSGVCRQSHDSLPAQQPRIR